jgi:uncharacterized protein (DUF1810 family)
MDDPFDLHRFVDAQHGVYDAVLHELRAGHKRTHWIWFVFPQLTALGHTSTARRYGISGVAEARAYLHHPVLGPRLHECTRAVHAIEGHTAQEVFGFPDYLKVRSCMTLFAHAAASAADSDDAADFNAVLDKFYADFPDGREDPATLQLLASDTG